VDGGVGAAVHDALVGCSHVAAVGSGLAGGAATYLPGRRIEGVRVTDEALELEIRMCWGPTAADVAADVRSAVGPLAPGKRVDVSITDVVMPGEALDGAPSTLHESETP
jgi:hypothetical protein